MLLHLTDTSAEPLHRQISRQIREKILAGELREGGELPSIRGMAADQRVSVITVQRAYQDLEREGLIYTRRGIGIFVARLTEEQRKRLAVDRFREAAGPVVAGALAAGLSAEEITAIVERLVSLNGEMR
ncbi:MAG: GntR family transcriptional regulator [Candidatus Zixiibacteriota bacterium]|nr:MAG: GntR family transcriptional regulator [candidate division Zixibacteria bacterium]